MSSSSSLSSSSSSSGSRKKKKKFIGIVKLDLTYGKNTMGPPQFHRVPGNVNRNSEQDFDDSVFVWYKPASNGEYITDIVTIREGENPPTEKYVVIKKDLTNGASKVPIYLCYLVSSTNPMIISKIELAYDEEKDKKNTTEILPGISLRLTRIDRTKSEQSDFINEKTPDQLQVGDFIEVLDTVQKWCVARVLEVNQDKKTVMIKYSGWDDKWNEEINFKSSRLCVQLGTHVAVTDNTGSKKRLKVGALWNISSERLSEMHKPLIRFISGKSDEKSIEWMMEMQDFVRKCLISDYVDDLATPNRVNTYLERVVVAFAHCLKGDKRISPIFLHSFKRIFSPCYFYDHFGKASMGSRFSSFFGARGKYDGTYAEQNGYVSDYLVSSINAFGKAGGFDSVMKRLSSSSSSSSKPSDTSSTLASTTSNNKASSKTTDDESTDSITMEELDAVLHAFANVSELFPSSFKRKYFPQFQALVFQRMLSMDIKALRSLAQNQRSDGIVTFQSSTKSLFDLLGNVLKGEEADRALEVFKLRLAKRLMSTPFFTLKLRGSDDLIEQINMTLRRERRDSFRERGDRRKSEDESSGGMFSRIFRGKGYRSTEDSQGNRRKPERAKARWLKCKWLSEWIVKSKIVELLLKSPGDTHTELLKRSRRVLLFLAQNEDLTTYDMKLLCGHINTDETTRKDVYVIVEDLATELPVSQLAELFQIVVDSSSSSSKSVEFLEFLQRYTENAMFREMKKRVSSSKRNSYALPMLWNMIMSKDSEETQVERATHALSQILCSKKCPKSYMKSYVAKIMKKLQEHDSIPRTLRVLKCLMSGGADDEEDEDSSEEFDDEENRTFSINNSSSRREALLELVVSDTISYSNKSTNGALSLSSKEEEKKDENNNNNNNDNAWNRVLVKECQPHRIEIQGRLDFLRFVVKETTIELSFGRIKSLYELFCVNPVTIEECHMFLSILTSCVHQTEGFITISKSTTQRVFHDLLCANLSLCTSEEGYACFEAYFRKVNEFASSMRISLSSFVVDSVDLEGLEELWKIVLSTNDEIVVEDASSFLVGLYVRLTSRITDKKSVWRLFIDKVMKYLEKKKEPERLMILLRDFLQQVSRSGRTKGGGMDEAMSGSYDARAVTHIYVDLRYEDGSQSRRILHYYLKRTETLRVLRDRIAADSGGLEGNAGSLIKIRRCSDGKKLSVSSFDDEEIQSMTSSKDVDSRSLDVTVLKEPTRDTKKHIPKFLLPSTRTKEEQEYGQNLLTTNEKYFDILFTLLESDNTNVVDMAWNLLMKLPMNPKLKSRISSLDEKDKMNWKDLLDSNAMLKLLYSLQVVEKMLMKDGWSKHFCRLGGVKHLESLLLEIDVVKYVSGKLGSRCVVLLLEITSYMYTENASSGNNTIGLVRRAFELLRACALASERLLASSALKRRTSNESTGSLKRRSSRETVDKKKKEEDDVSRLLRYTTTFLVRVFTAEQDDTNVKDTEKLFMEFQDDMRGIILYSLIKCPIVRVRSTVAKNLIRFCEVFERASSSVGSTSGPRSALISTCLDMLEMSPRNEFFTLLTTLLRDASKQTKPFVTKDLKTIVSTLTRIIIQCPSKEEYEMADDERDGKNNSLEKNFDVQLRGSLQTLAGILNKCRDFEIPVDISPSLFRHVFQDGLFASLPKCKQNGTRAAAMRLLLEIARISKNLARSELLEMCCKHHTVPSVFIVTTRKENDDDDDEDEQKQDDLPVATATAVKPQEQHAYPKSKTGFVGLLNLGNICYMNATNQQLYMIRSFREGILESRSKKKMDETSVLYQLQRMFGYLRDGELQFYNPVAFCKVLKDWDGNSVNVAVQDDANLYFTKLIQNLEGNLEGTRSNPIRSNLSGLYGTEMYAKSKLTGKMIYKTCDDTENPFINVDVPGLHNLENALKHFFNDTVEYKWNGGTDKEEVLKTSKRMYIKRPPNHLLVYLKRFIPNYRVMPFRYDKVNDRMEFPMKLNMTKFSDEGRPISKELKAAMGDDAREDDADGDNEEYEYELSGVVVHRGIFSSGHYYSYIKARKDNDDDDEEKEEEEGGKDEWFEFNDTRVTPFDSKKIPKICFGTSTSSSTEKLTIASCTNAFCLVYDRKRGRKKDRRSSPPQKIVDEVCKFNSALWRKRIVNESYFNFVHDLMEIDSEKQCEAVQIGIRILFGNELKEMNADAESKWFELLRKILSTSKEGCRVFSQLLLGGSTQLIRELLIYPRDKTVRYAGRLMLCVVKTLVVDDDSEDDSKVDEEKTDASLESLIEQHDLDDSKRSIAFRVARRAWLVCKEEPIRTLSRDTLRYALSIVAAYQGKLLNAGCLPTLLKIFERCMYSDEDEETESFLNLLMSCLYTYVKSTDENETHTELVLAVARSIRKSKVSKEIFRYVCGRGKNSSSTAKIWIDTIMRSVDTVFCYEIASLIRCIRELAELTHDDTLYERLLKKVRQNEKYFFLTVFSIEHLFRAAKRSESLYNMLRKDKWISNWLEKNSSRPQNDFEDMDDCDDNQTCCFKSGLLNSYRRDLSSMNTALKVSTVKRRLELLHKSTNTTDFQRSDYDSDDDPESIVGRNIRVKWTKKYYQCKVIHYDKTKRKHYCKYEDGDRRYYKIGHDKCMQWEFVVNEKEE